MVVVLATAGCGLELPPLPGREPTPVSTPLTDAPSTPDHEADLPATPDDPASQPAPTRQRPDLSQVDPELWPVIQAAEQALYEGDYEQSIRLWQQVVNEADPETKPRWVLQLARAFYADKQHELAISHLSWVAAVESSDGLRAEALGLLGTVNEDKGDWQGAIAAYRDYLALRDDAAPFVYWRMARAYKTLGEISQQILMLEQIDISRLEPSFRAEVLAELAAAYRRNWDHNSALRVYDEILSFAEFPSYRALITHYKGETLREASHDADAFEAFYSVVTEQPESFAAYLSLQELAGLPEPPPPPVASNAPSADEEDEPSENAPPPAVEARAAMTDLMRGKIYFYAQQYPKALEYLNYHIQAEPPLGMAEARYYLGNTLAKQGQFAEAAKHYDRAIELAGDQELLADAWLSKAWAIGASGSDPSPFYYEFYVTHPSHPRAPEALWQAAQASERGRNWTQAALYYGTLATEYASHERAGEAAFREGLAAYAQNDPYTASTIWRAVYEETEAPAERARLLTWLGLSAQLAGQMDQADVFWNEAVRVSPETYYGLRARDLLKHAPPRLASGVDPQVSPGLPDSDEAWQALDDWVTGWYTASATLDAPNHAWLGEIDALEQLGWHTEATQSLRRLQQEVRDNPRDLLILARLTQEWSVYPSMVWCAQRIARLAQEAGVGDPPDDLLRLAYPNLYNGLVEANAERYDLDPLLLLAVVRQESLFSPWARSYAGALGLAQVMPATGEWIAERLQVEGYHHDLLLRPHVSLHYGAWFLDLLLGMYDRDWIATLVAYNAGPGNLRNWTNGQPIEDHDLFYETIPVQQAQDYVTYIYEHYRRYERLYRDGTP